MGMYDTLIFACGKCRKMIGIQTKVLGKNLMDTLKVGDKIQNKELSDCIFKMKNKCEFCGKQNAIRIKNMKIIEIIKDKNEEILNELDENIITETLWGGYSNG